MASGQKSSFLYFCAGWIWGHLNEISVLWEVMYLLLSLDHHLMNFYVKAVLAVHSFACHWTWAKNINFAICKCLILWLYLNSGLWLFLDFTEFHWGSGVLPVMQGQGLCYRGDTELVLVRHECWFILLYPLDVGFWKCHNLSEMWNYGE